MAIRTKLKPGGTQDRKSREETSYLAQNLRKMRTEKGFKLDDLASRSGLAISTLSKIENQLISPTFDTLLALADGLEIGISQLVSRPVTAQASGRRAINRQGDGALHSTPVYDYRFLATEIRNKAFTPIIAEIKAQSTRDFPALSSHDGEEFFYVISGAVTLHTDLYAPTDLEAGDCIYFDSAMGHALIAASQDTRVLWISSKLGDLVGGSHRGAKPKLAGDGHKGAKG